MNKKEKCSILDLSFQPRFNEVSHCHFRQTLVKPKLNAIHMNKTRIPTNHTSKSLTQDTVMIWSTLI